MILSDTSPFSPPPPRLPRLTLAGVATTLGLATTLVVGLARAAASEYFRAFGLAPEEAGFGQFRLSSFLTVVGIVLAVLAVMLASGIAIYRAAMHALTSAPDDAVGVRRLAWLTVLVLLALGALAALLPPSATTSLLGRGLVYGAGFGVLAGALWFLVRNTVWDGLSGASRWWVRTVPSALALVAIFFASWIGLQIIEAGGDLADLVLETGSLEAAAGLEDFVVEALVLQVVPVEPLEREDPALTCAVLIGRGGGTAWVLAPSAEGDTRLLPRSVQDVEPKLDADARACWPDS